MGVDDGHVHHGGGGCEEPDAARGAGPGVRPGRAGGARVTARVGYHWHLRRLMAEHDMFATSDLLPLLAERGVSLSREQVYRLVARTPQRLSLKARRAARPRPGTALCDILGCAPGDLVEPYRLSRPRPARAVGESGTPPKPRRARVVRAGPG